MAVHYARDDSQRRIFLTLTGAVGVELMIAVIDRQAGEGTWTYSVLSDTRALTIIPTEGFNRALVSRVCLHTARLGPRGPVAIVSSRTVNFGMARMYALLSENAGILSGVCAFRNMAAARLWLDQCVPPVSRSVGDYRIRE
jgi:hypothetical protein